MDRLNLGSGNNILPNTVNHDRAKHRPEIDVAHDLDVLPWPWADASFDVIVARSVLEHLKLNLIESLDECWRLLRPRGQIFVKVPHWQSDVAYRDPTHRWQFSLHSLDLFVPETEYGRDYGFYTSRKWAFAKPPVLNKAQSSILASLEVVK